MNETFTFRAPGGWASHLDSARMQAWLGEFLRSPRSLPDDPGPGDDRLCLSLPKRPVNVLAAMLDANPSVALRRLAADHLSGYEAVSMPLEAITNEAIARVRSSGHTAEVRPAPLISSAPLVREESVHQESMRQELTLPARPCQSPVSRFSVWRLAAVIALLVLVPVVFLYLSLLLGGGEGASEVRSVYQDFVPLEDYDFDALAEG